MRLKPGLFNCPFVQLTWNAPAGSAFCRSDRAFPDKENHWCWLQGWWPFSLILLGVRLDSVPRKKDFHWTLSTSLSLFLISFTGSVWAPRGVALIGIELLAGVLLLPLVSSASLVVVSIFGLRGGCLHCFTCHHHCPQMACKIPFGEWGKCRLWSVFTQLIAMDPSALWDRGKPGTVGIQVCVTLRCAFRNSLRASTVHHFPTSVTKWGQLPCLVWLSQFLD